MCLRSRHKNAWRKFCGFKESVCNEPYGGLLLKLYRFGIKDNAMTCLKATSRTGCRCSVLTIKFQALWLLKVESHKEVFLGPYFLRCI